MDEGVLIQSRVALHGVAELVIAGPQYRASGKIRMKVVPGGFAGLMLRLRVEGVELVGESGRWPLQGTYRALAEAAGVDVGRPEGLYHDTSGQEPDDEIVVDAAAAAVIADAFGRGDAGLRIFAPQEDPVLWPEHFDVGITVDEVNYGISPGDGGHARPYAYVGPHTPRSGDFWNAPFGALRPMDDLPDADAVAEFFRAGQAAAKA